MSKIKHIIILDEDIGWKPMPAERDCNITVLYRSGEQVLISAADNDANWFDPEHYQNIRHMTDIPLKWAHIQVPSAVTA